MRFLIAALLVVGALAAGCGGGGDGSDAGGDERRERDLVVQTAEGGGFADGGQGLTLTLRPVSAVTTTFSERPARDARAISTADFVAGFDRAFGDDPPNATVSSLDRAPGEFVVELSKPRYDRAASTLTYAARPIGAEPSGLPRRFGPVSVFIDPDTVAPPISVSGVVRDEAGNAVDGATVTFSNVDGPVSATTDDAGAYRVDGLVGGSQTPTATANLPGGPFDELVEVVGPYLDPGENTQDFTLTRADPGGP